MEKSISLTLTSLQELELGKIEKYSAGVSLVTLESKTLIIWSVMLSNNLGVADTRAHCTWRAVPLLVAKVPPLEHLAPPFSPREAGLISFLHPLFQSNAELLCGTVSFLAWNPPWQHTKGHFNAPFTGLIIRILFSPPRGAGFSIHSISWICLRAAVLSFQVMSNDGKFVNYQKIKEQQLAKLKGGGGGRQGEFKWQMLLAKSTNKGLFYIWYLKGRDRNFWSEERKGKRILRSTTTSSVGHSLPRPDICSPGLPRLQCWSPRTQSWASLVWWVRA